MTDDSADGTVPDRPQADPTVPAEKGQIPLSVVIITENEEDRVAECIESVIQACSGLSAFEVILVDSASTDRTVERALEYPITVLRIPDEHTVSCGAGRYVGDQVASGEMVLHVDGDMELTETWLPLAIDYLETEEDVAAVEGCLDRSTQEGVLEVDKVGGVMLYDAKALQEIGGFDPYLLGYEDIDVGYQLRRAGYRLIRLPDVSAIHHHDDTIAEPFRRWRQGYSVAPGQAVRKWVRSPTILGRLLRRQRYKFAIFAWFVVGIVALIVRPLLLGWGLLSAVAFGIVVRKRGYAGALTFFLGKSLGVVGFLLGVTRKTKRAEEYPLAAVEVLSTGQILEGNSQTTDRFTHVSRESSLGREVGNERDR